MLHKYDLDAIAGVADQRSESASVAAWRRCSWGSRSWNGIIERGVAVAVRSMPCVQRASCWVHFEARTCRALADDTNELWELSNVRIRRRPECAIKSLFDSRAVRRCPMSTEGSVPATLAYLTQGFAQPLGKIWDNCSSRSNASPFCPSSGLRVPAGR